MIKHERTELYTDHILMCQVFQMQIVFIEMLERFLMRRLKILPQ